MLKKALSSVIILILIIVNVSLLLKNRSLLFSIDKVESICRIDKQYKNVLIDEINYYSSNFNEISSAVSNNSELIFLLFIREDDCTNCIAQESDRFNLFKRFDKITLKSFLECKDSSLLSVFKKEYNINFDIDLIQTFNDWKEIDILNTPAILVLSKDYQVIDSYISIPEEYKKRNNFYKKWELITSKLL